MEHWWIHDKLDCHELSVRPCCGRKKKKHNETIKISLSTSFSDFPFSQIVDATFDHITPLAIEKMPSFLESTVRQAVSDNFNLNVAEQLAEYPGPVRLIKRAKDEMITTE